MKLVNETFHC